MAVARYYASNAVDTTLSAGIGSADLSMIVGSVSGFPGSYPYTLAIDYDTSSEELVDVTYASGTTLTITRAVDSTIAVSHASAAPVKHVISGRDLREAQEHYNATGRYSVVNGVTTENFDLHGITTGEGNVVGTLKSQTLTNKTLTSPTINGATLDAASTIGGVSGTTLAANQASWTSSWTPTWSGTSVNATGASSPSYRYSVTGKTVNFRISVVKGTSNFGTADLAFSTPPGYTPLGTTIGSAVFNNGTQRYPGIAVISTSGTITPLANPDVTGTLNYGRSPTNTTVPFTWGTSDSIIITGTYEVA